MEQTFDIATTGMMLKDLGSKTVEGVKTIGNDLDEAMKTSYMKEAPKDLSKSFADLKSNLQKDVNKETVGATWQKFKSNLREVFGNAKENLKNKKYSNIFEAPDAQPKTAPVNNAQEVVSDTFSKPGVQVADNKLLQSEIYRIEDARTIPEGTNHFDE